MTIEQIREKILHDDAFVLAELKKLQYLYGLKRVIRNNFTRIEEVETDSVAEHIYAMGILVHYFAKLEDIKNQLDMCKVYQLIFLHDIEEIETGDKITWLKTEEDRLCEKNAIDTVISNTPHLLHDDIKQITTEYNEHLTQEAQFVKAIDKIEPVFFLLNSNGKKHFETSMATESQYSESKLRYTKKYPYIFRFFKVATAIFRQEGYFSDTK
jgi:5'-deoxynucleotidase YfbR-like HD superfamily hydrolase